MTEFCRGAWPSGLEPELAVCEHGWRRRASCRDLRPRYTAVAQRVRGRAQFTSTFPENFQTAHYARRLNRNPRQRGRCPPKHPHRPIMSRSTIPRQLARTLFQSTTHSSAPQTRCAAVQFTLPFSSSSPRHDDDQVRERENRLKEIVPLRTRPHSPAKLDVLARTTLQTSSLANFAMERAVNDSRRVNTDVLGQSLDQLPPVESPQELGPTPEPYHFHIYSHRHNTHVTVTRPNRDPIVSLSCGNLGFRKANRKNYDAAYQLGAYVIDKLQQQGWHNKIDAMEVSLRGFGPGREAVTKVLLGTEGRLLREKITKVSDSTRLKFGGTRSKKPRRL